MLWVIHSALSTVPLRAKQQRPFVRVPTTEPTVNHTELREVTMGGPSQGRHPPSPVHLAWAGRVAIPALWSSLVIGSCQQGLSDGGRVQAGSGRVMRTVMTPLFLAMAEVSQGGVTRPGFCGITVRVSGPLGLVVMSLVVWHLFVFQAQESYPVFGARETWMDGWCPLHQACHGLNSGFGGQIQTLCCVTIHVALT
jgi:hypothetical protein